MPRDAVLRLYNGLNAIDLLSDGHRGQVVVSRRENADAHGYSTALFQVRARPACTDRQLRRSRARFGLRWSA